MPRLIFIHGDKGGVGKSVLARALLDHYIRNDIAVDAYDSDKRNPDISRFYAKRLPVSLVDLASHQAFDAVLDRLAAGQGRALVDLAAGAGDALHTLVTGDVKLAGALTELNARATVVYVLSRSRPSVAGLGVALKDFQDVPADWVVVRNTYFGAADRFSRYETSNARKEALARGAREIVMPELLDDLYDELDQASTPFMNAAEAGALSFTNRRRVRAWIEAMDAQIATVADIL